MPKLETLWQLIPSEGWQRFALDLVWQSTLVGLIALVVLSWLRRGVAQPQPALRAWLAPIAACLMLATPLVSLAARQNGWGLWNPGSNHNTSDATAVPPQPLPQERPITYETPLTQASPQKIPQLPEQLASEPLESQPPEIVGSVDSIPGDYAFSGIDSLPAQAPAQIVESGPADEFPPLLPPELALAPLTDAQQDESRWSWSYFIGALLAAWACGSLAMMVRTVRGIVAVRALVQASQPCEDSVVRGAIDRAAMRLDMHRTPEPVVHASIASPAVVAWPRWVMLLPDEPSIVDSEAWFGVCCHELAHLKRHDLWWRGLIQAVITLLPWQPLAWLLRREHAQACEESCDQWALSAGADPLRLAETLLSWLQRAQWSNLALSAVGQRWGSQRRIEVLLHFTGNPAPRVHPIWLGGIVMSLLLLVVLLGCAQSSEKPGQIAARPDEEWIYETHEAPLAAEAADALEASARPKSSYADLVTGDGPTVSPYLNLLNESRDAESAATADDDNSAIPPLPPGEESATTFEQPAQSEPLDLELPDAPPENEAPQPQPVKPGRYGTKAKRAKADRPPAYRIGPPDVLSIEIVKVIPRSPYRLGPLDRLKLRTGNALPDNPVQSDLKVSLEGDVELGPGYGRCVVAGMTVNVASQIIEKHLSEILIEPQVSLSLDEAASKQFVSGEHLVGPDGTISIGIYGEVFVAGMTMAEARQAIEKQLLHHLQNPQVALSVVGYHSKVYYLLIRDPKRGDRVTRLPITGNDTILDALANSALDHLESYNIYVLRRIEVETPEGKEAREEKLPVQLINQGDWATLADNANFTMRAGDRVVIEPTNAHAATGAQPATGGYPANSDAARPTVEPRTPTPREPARAPTQLREPAPVESRAPRSRAPFGAQAEVDP